VEHSRRTVDMGAIVDIDEGAERIVRRQRRHGYFKSLLLVTCRKLRG